MNQTIVLEYYPFEQRRYTGYSASFIRRLKEIPQLPCVGVMLTDAEIREAILAGGARSSEQLKNLATLAKTQA